VNRNGRWQSIRDLRIAMRRPQVPDWPGFQGQRKQETPGQRPDLGFTLEPPSGFEPETYALRVHRAQASTTDHVLPHGSCRAAGVEQQRYVPSIRTSPEASPTPLLLGLFRDFQRCLRDFRGTFRRLTRQDRKGPPTQVRGPFRAKPQAAADESGCTPGSVARSPRGGRGDGHPSRIGVAAGLVRSTRGLGRAALERPRRAAFYSGPS
jgi:hypothetical protein